MRNNLGLKNKKKTIVFFIDSLTSKEGVIGGTERQLLSLIARLDGSRYKLVLITLKSNCTSNYLSGLNIDWISLNVSRLFSLKTLIQLLNCTKLLNRLNACAINTFFFDASLFGIIAGIFSSVPKRYQFRRDMGFWLNWRLMPFQILINLLSTKIVVNSSAIKAQIVKHERVLPEKIEIIYNGIDLDCIDKVKPVKLTSIYPSLKSDAAVIGLVANYNRRVKRVDLALKMLAILKRNVPNAVLVIVGFGSLKQELELLCEKLDIVDSVIFAGQQKEAIKFIKDFDVGLLTSDSEGFSNVIMEYMASSIPVVATNSGGNAELIQGRAGILVQVDDEYQLADAVVNLLNNPNLCIKMGNIGYQIIRMKFTWDKIMRQIEKLYFD